MHEDANLRYPFERDVAYLGGLTGVGVIFGYLACAIMGLIFPNANFDEARWTLRGGALTGLAGLAWLASNSLY